MLRGAWGTQAVKRPTLGQVIISWSVGSSPMSGSVLTALSLDPASDSVSPLLSDPPPPPQKEINIKNFLKSDMLSTWMLGGERCFFKKNFYVHLFLRHRA